MADQDPTPGDNTPDADPWARHTPEAPYTVHADADAAGPSGSSGAAGSFAAPGSFGSSGPAGSAGSVGGFGSADPADAFGATDTDDTDAAPARRRPDPVALTAGVVALVVAGLGLLGPTVLGSLDPRWVLASAALAVGVVVLLTTVRPRPHRR